jgi:uncharacterized protein (TIGR03905 family)
MKYNKDYITYKFDGTCCKGMTILIKDNKINDIEFIGGCIGNLIGVRALVIDMNIAEVIKKFDGLPCGNKSTSCPNEIAKCLKEYRNGPYS